MEPIYKNYMNTRKGNKRNYTTIMVLWPTYDRLVERRQGLDSFNDVIERLLDLTDPEQSGIPNFTKGR